MRLGNRAFALLIVVFLAGGCDTSPDEEYARPSDIGTARTREVRRIEAGKAAYLRYCVGCHGEKGDGNGEAAKFFMPKPRDLVLAEYKFSSTRSGQLPTDEDLKRTIRNGLRGSAMPPFRLLSDGTIDSLVAYVKTLSPSWKEYPPARPVPLVNDPYRDEPDKSEAIARGETIYHGYASCWTCHPAYVSADQINKARMAVKFDTRDWFRDHLQQAEGKENTKGQLIYPPDFKRDYVRAGMSVDDLYRSISAGITGTAMPTWVDSMDLPNPAGGPPLVTTSDLWALAYYVQDLMRQRPPRFSEEQVVVRDRKRVIYLHGEPPKPEAGLEEEDEGEEMDFEFD